MESSAMFILVMTLFNFSIYLAYGAYFEGCNLGDVSQPCNSTVQQYYFEPINCSCKALPLGQCQEPGFVTEQQCILGCAATKCPVCNLPKSHGPCTNDTRKYYYNIKTCRCEKFVFGGCGGNSNRFDTLTDCENMCGDFACPVCNLPQEPGNCKGLIRKWYFDDITCQCKTFDFTGCDGNNNRYYTETDCQRACFGVACRKMACTYDVDVGPCDKFVTRYFYNETSNNCESFEWGGCEPNGNNFITKRSCKKKCIRSTPPDTWQSLG